MFCAIYMYGHVILLCGVVNSYIACKYINGKSISKYFSPFRYLLHKAVFIHDHTYGWVNDVRSVGGSDDEHIFLGAHAVHLCVSL